MLELENIGSGVSTPGFDVFHMDCKIGYFSKVNLMSVYFMANILWTFSEYRCLEMFLEELNELVNIVICSEYLYINLEGVDCYFGCTFFLFLHRIRIGCNYAASSGKEAYSSGPIDVVADVKTEKVLNCFKIFVLCTKLLS